MSDSPAEALLAAARAILAGAGETPVCPPLDELARRFSLEPAERALLALAAAQELDAALLPEPLTFAAAIARLGAAPRLLSPEAPLRYWRMVEPRPGEPLLRAPLRLDERILLWLMGVEGLDERLLPLVDGIAVDGPVEPALIGPLAAALGRHWQGGPPRKPAALVENVAPSALARACAALGLGLLRLRLAEIPVRADDRDLLRRLLEREAVLLRSAILLEGDAPHEQRAAAAALADRLRCFLALSDPALAAVLARGSFRLSLPRPDFQARLAAWQAALGPAAEKLNGAVEVVADQFRLDPGEIEAAARALAVDPGPMDLWEAGRRAARLPLDGLAQPILTRAGWAELVLPEGHLATLRTIAAQVRRRALVHEAWGFERGELRGDGLVVLFAGPSGTGKTLAAEVLATELKLDLWRIDLAQVVSKWVGETEKNLRRLFDAAERGGAVLLFDEADVLFGRRSEVKESHDRFANIEVGYLLQRVEAFAGLAILTTNMKDAMDAAFLRRLRFVMGFPLPDREQRLQLWRRAFPAAAPRDGLDLERLARLPLTGGSIRTIALNAAFLAADAGQPIGMRQLRDAVRAEYAKLERPLSEADLGERA